MPEVVGTLKTPRLATAPAGPVPGQMYFDTTTNELKHYNGTAWVAGGAGGADLVYNGDFGAGGPAYTDGDIVIQDGVAYMCVAPTSAAPTPWSGGAGSYVPSSPSCRVYHNASQTIPANSVTPIAFNSERWDTDGIHDPVTNNSRLTCKTAGKYLIFGHFQWAGDPGGNNQVHFRLNGSAQIHSEIFFPVNQTSRAISTVWDLAVGDYVEFTAFTSTAGGLAIQSATSFSPEFGMAMIGGPRGPAGPGTPSYGTTLPASPIDGQEAILVDSVTAPTYQWRFRYNAGSSSAYKWEFVGGPPAAVNGGSVSGLLLSTGAIPVTGLATITVPRAGDYNCRAGCFIQVTTFGGTVQVSAYPRFSIKGDMQPISAILGFIYDGGSFAAESRVNGITAGETWQMLVTNNGNTSQASVSGAFLSLTPIRVS